MEYSFFAVIGHFMGVQHLSSFTPEPQILNTLFERIFSCCRTTRFSSQYCERSIIIASKNAYLEDQCSVFHTGIQPFGAFFSKKTS